MMPKHTMPATLFVVPSADTTDVIDSNADVQGRGFRMSDLNLSKLASYVKSKYQPKRGDVVQIEDFYDFCHGDGQYIFDGTDFVSFGDNEFAELPSTFHILTEFSVDHWNYINVSGTLWLNLNTFRSKMLANVRRGYLPYIEEEVMYTSLIHDGEYYQIIFEEADDDDDIQDTMSSESLEVHQIPYILKPKDVPIPSNILFTW